MSPESLSLRTDHYDGTTKFAETRLVGAADAYANQESEVRAWSDPNLDFSPTDEFPPDLLNSDRLIDA